MRKTGQLSQVMARGTSSKSPAISLPQFMVHVTQADIDVAIPANSGHCMIADAVKRAFSRSRRRSAFAVSVDLQTIRFTNLEKRVRYVYLTPPVAQRGLLQFDQGIKPTPFSFRLRHGQVMPMFGSVPGRKGTKKTQKKAKLQVQVIGSRNKGRVERRVTVGGKAPPPAVLAGNRRTFGIRLAGGLDGPTQLR
jgi:hypothetical protein